MHSKPFSKHLETWLKSDKPKTLQGLVDNFAEKSFAILFLVLMAISALPLPTGGLTHIFEVITMLLALELIAGAPRVWLPKRWRGLHLAPRLQNATLPTLVKVIRRVERYSRPRLNVLLNNVVIIRVVGLLVFALSLSAFLAPPFSGLDTLPSLGVVLISLAVILEDFLVFVLGLAIGAAGIGLIIGVGKALVTFIT